jgi:hypothetical protein
MEKTEHAHEVVVKKPEGKSSFERRRSSLGQKQDLRLWSRFNWFRVRYNSVMVHFLPEIGYISG